MKKRGLDKFIPRSLRVLAALTIVCLFSQASSKQSAMNPFSDFTWKNRIIVVFADGFNDEYYKKQIQLLRVDTVDLKERNLVVYGVSKKVAKCEYGSKSNNINAKEVRDYYRINDGVPKTILIGKDSGEKQRWYELVSTVQIFGLIDSMPMRQSEIRRNKN
jgi:hypothetical protein